MYSYEIESYLKSRNFTFKSYLELEDLLKQSPQIVHIKYTGCDNDFAYYDLNTNDDYSWNIKILKYK